MSFKDTESKLPIETQAEILGISVEELRENKRKAREAEARQRETEDRERESIPPESAVKSEVVENDNPPASVETAVVEVQSEIIPVAPSVTETTSAPILTDKFLSTLFDGIDSEFYTNLVAFPSNYRKKSYGEKSREILWFKISALDAMIKQAMILSKKGYDVSFLAGAIDPDTYQRRKKENPKFRGSENDIACVRCLHADIDVEAFDADGKPIHKQNEKLAPSIEAALAIIPPELKPSVVINSGHGVHLYWILDEILDLHDPIQRKRFERMTANLREILSANPEHYSIDAKFGASSILRMPETFNLKTWAGGNKKDLPIVTIIDRSDAFACDALETMLSELAGHLIPVTNNPREISDSQRESVGRKYSTQSEEMQVSNQSVREIINGSRDLSLIYQNCPVIRAVVNNPQNLSHDIAKHVFPSLLKFKDNPIDGGRELCVELCKQWLGEKYDPNQTERQLNGIYELNNACDTIHEQHRNLPCAHGQCTIYKRGGRCPAAILGNRFSNDLGGTIGDTFADAPECVRDLIVPNGFDISEEGIFFEKKEDVTLAVSSTFFCISRFICVENQISLRYWEILCRINGQWHTRLIDSKIINKTADLGDALLDAGINVDASQARLANKYLVAFKAVNEGNISRLETLEKLGWREDWHFIHPVFQTNDNGEELYKISGLTILDYLNPRGKLDDAIKIMQLARRYPIARLMYNAQFLAPMVKILGIRNPIIYIHSESEAGKSAALVAANSVFGSSKFMVEINGTEKSLVDRFFERNDLPTNFNEWQHILEKNRSQFANTLIRSFESGESRGKLARNGKQLPTKSYRGVLLMTGEKDLLDEESAHGLKTRTIDLRVDGVVGATDKDGRFVTDDETCEIFWENHKQGMTQCVLGIDFIRRIQADLREYGVDGFKNSFNECRERLRELRQCLQHSHIDTLAALMLVDMIVQKYYIDTPNEEYFDQSRDWIVPVLHQIPTREKNRDLNNARDLIEDWYNSNEGFFQDPVFITQTDSDKEFIRKSRFVRLGYITDRDGRQHIHAIPSKLKDMLKEHGLNVKSELVSLAKRGLIKIDLDKNRLDTNVWIDGSSKHVITLTFLTQRDEKMSSRDQDIASEAMADDEDVPADKCPF